jgi:hypothetical protein
MATFHSPDEAQTELHRLILVAVPPDKNGAKTIIHAAKTLGINKATIWNWIKLDRITPARAKEIVAMGRIDQPEGADGRVSLDQFHPFVYAP